jgi:hypothetical protein
MWAMRAFQKVGKVCGATAATATSTKSTGEFIFDGRNDDCLSFRVDGDDDDGCGAKTEIIVSATLTAKAHLPNIW